MLAKNFISGLHSFTRRSYDDENAAIHERDLDAVVMATPQLQSP